MTNNIYLNIAGFNIKLHFKKTSWFAIKKIFLDQIIKYHHDFIIKQKPMTIDIIINFVEKKGTDVIIKRCGNKYFVHLFEKVAENEIISFYHTDLLHFQLMIWSLISEMLINHNGGFFLHSSAVNIKGKANIFLGKTGEGKTTLRNLLQSHFPSLSDDISVIKKELNTYYYYQSPFTEKEYIKKQTKKYPIERIFFLRKASFVKIEKIEDKVKIFEELSKQLWVEKNYYKKQLNNLLNLINNFNNFYFLYFNKKKEELIKILRQT